MYNKILKLPAVVEITGKCRSGIYQEIADGTFPKQINLGPRAVGWLESEIQAWIDSRIQSRDSGNLAQTNQ
jgi:prophage regulatory protein